ncbi:hypothetical protein CHS0354_006840 [Potamilus streckersoni]|uniref:Transketolase-like pyrimidine-binding domain-containing protein n=1 Tax=Potamilus streckersoni TaxID=2493646 RepID=A0AAE0TEF0_9BIVA|nr:hypothetical protein CHS0354_006840 [Potamilus streckersoni]
MKETEIRAVNTIRCLSADIVQKAKSGHPGMPMGMAGVAFLLFAKLMRHNPQNPKWFNRDRLLHLCGYEKMTMSELKSFRQWGSLTAGHPEYMPDAGIEITTGPLGQGIANAVGLAMAAKYTAAYFNESGFPLVTHKTFVIAGDGCMQEGISGEACSLAGHLKLDNLFVIYDSNSITIDGSTSLSFSEDVVMRYRAYGWHTVVYNGDTEDISAVEAKLRSEMEKQDKPVLFVFPSVIGYGSPNKAGTKDVHGSPLGDEELKLTKQNWAWIPIASFNIPAEVHDYFNGIKSRLQKTEADWEQLLEKYRQSFPEKHAQFISGAKPSAEAFSKALPVFDSGEMATRSASGKVLDAVMPLFPMIVGGSADLTPSNNTRFKDVQDFMPDNYKGRYIRYGVREHAMAAINNGISVHGLTRAYGATFLCFSDYARPAIRLAAFVSLSVGVYRYARQYRTGRGRSYSSAGRASGSIACDTRTACLAPGGCKRNRLCMADDFNR